MTEKESAQNGKLPIFYAGDDVRQVKLEKLRSGMVQHGLDGLLVIRPEGIRYATDFYAKGYRRFLEIEYCLLMDVAGRQVLGYTSGSDDERLARRSFLEDVRRLHGPPADWAPIIASMLTDYGLATARVGFDLLPAELHIALTGLLPGVQLVSAANYWEAISAYKHPLEIECMRDAFKVVMEGIVAGMRAAQPGVREIDVAAEMEYVMRRAGNEMCPAITMVASGPNAAIFERVATDRRIEPNELVIIDATAVRNGYSSDAARTVLAGDRPSPEQVEIYQTCQAALASAIAACKVGATCSDVDAAARQVYAESPWARYGSRWATGHQIGFGLHGSPLVGPGSTTQLRPNMVMCLEPRLHVTDRLDVGGVQLEDAVLITEGSAEVLTAKLPYWDPLPLGGS